MTALAERTVEVTPLGLRGRYSLTPEMQRAYLAIVRMMEDGFKPSHDDIAAALGLASKRGTARLVDALCERGWITVRRREHRGIRLVEPVLRDLKPCR